MPLQQRPVISGMEGVFEGRIGVSVGIQAVHNLCVDSEMCGQARIQITLKARRDESPSAPSTFDLWDIHISRKALGHGSKTDAIAFRQIFGTPNFSVDVAPGPSVAETACVSDLLRRHLDRHHRCSDNNRTDQQ